jgi:hypothetical protein
MKLVPIDTPFLGLRCGTYKSSTRIRRSKRTREALALTDKALDSGESARGLCRAIPQSPKQRLRKKTTQRLARSTKPSADADIMEIDQSSENTAQNITDDEAAGLLLYFRKKPREFPPHGDDTQVEDDVADEEESVFAGYAAEDAEVPFANEHAAIHWTDELASQWPRNDRALYMPFLEDLKNWTKLPKDSEKKQEIIKYLNQWPGLHDKAKKVVWQDLNNWPCVGLEGRQVILQKGTSTYSHNCSSDNVLTVCCSSCRLGRYACHALYTWQGKGLVHPAQKIPHLATEESSDHSQSFGQPDLERQKIFFRKDNLAGATVDPGPLHSPERTGEIRQDTESTHR